MFRMFRNVLWATDGSAHADRALIYATQLARGNGATLHVVHIVEKLANGRVAGQDSRMDEPEIDDRIRAQASAAAADGLKVNVHMTAGWAGHAASLISQVAKDVEADVIVVGTRGHSAVVNTLIGSVTQRLLHTAACPVLAVPPPRPGSVSAEESTAAAILR